MIQLIYFTVVGQYDDDEISYNISRQPNNSHMVLDDIIWDSYGTL